MLQTTHKTYKQPILQNKESLEVVVFKKGHTHNSYLYLVDQNFCEN